MIPLGLAIAGPLAEVIGVRAWFLVAGIAMAVTGVLALFVPAIVHLEDRAEGKAAKTTGGGDPSVVAPVAQ
jgi:MFS family permease